MAAGRPVRVLHLRDSPWIDGPGRTILETATRIDRSRVDYQVGVFVSNPNETHPLVAELQKRGLPVHAIPDRGGLGSELVQRIVKLIDELDIEVLHTSEFRSNVLAAMIRRRRAVKIVSTVHGWIANDLRGKLYSLGDRLVLRGFDRVILVSYAMRRRIPAWWLPDTRLRVLRNALMTETYGQDLLSAQRRVPDPRRDVRLLNVGRLSVEKGQVLLLRAVAALMSEYPGLRLSFAGIGPLEQQLRAHAVKLGVADRVEFLGFVRDMPRLYAASDLVVQSSLTEGMPNVILEAVYLGIPVVATDVGGTREIVRHGVNGFLVRRGSMSELREAIRKYLSSPASLVATASKGRSLIEAEFSYPARTAMQTDLYEELIRRPA
jgi:glycosyltransferase involved in cell wall biosynthesis